MVSLCGILLWLSNVQVPPELRQVLQELLLHSFHRQAHGDPERLNELSRITQSKMEEVEFKPRPQDGQTHLWGFTGSLGSSWSGFSCVFWDSGPLWLPESCSWTLEWLQSRKTGPPLPLQIPAPQTWCHSPLYQLIGISSYQQLCAGWPSKFILPPSLPTYLGGWP